jgi:hypothetical protein
MQRVVQFELHNSNKSALHREVKVGNRRCTVLCHLLGSCKKNAALQQNRHAETRYPCLQGSARMQRWLDRL